MHNERGGPGGRCRAARGRTRARTHTTASRHAPCRCTVAFPLQPRARLVVALESGRGAGRVAGRAGNNAHAWGSACAGARCRPIDQKLLRAGSRELQFDPFSLLRPPARTR